MQYRRLIICALGASFALAAVGPAFADEDWRRHEWDEHRHQEWREHEWREHERREHEWREREGFYAPPPVYGWYQSPPAYYGYPRW